MNEKESQDGVKKHCCPICSPHIGKRSNFEVASPNHPREHATCSMAIEYTHFENIQRDLPRRWGGFRIIR